MTDRKAIIILDQLSPNVVDRVLEEAEEYRGRLFKRMLADLFIANLVLLSIWCASLSPELSEVRIFRAIPGAALLSGFGLLATFVVAVQIQARSMKRTQKWKNPGPVDFLDFMCRIISVAAMSLMTLSIVNSFNFGGTAGMPPFDALSIFGSLVFGGLVALFASDAAEHSQLIDARSDAFLQSKMREQRVILKAFPRRHFSSKRPTGHVLILLVAYPALCAVAAWLWVGPWAFLPCFFMAIGIACLAIYQLSKIYVMWSRKQWWALTGHLVLGLVLWLLYGTAVLVVGLGLAAGGRWGTVEIDMLSGLFHFMSFYIVSTVLPFYAGAWMCRTKKRGRGLILEVAVRRTMFRLLELRKRSFRQKGIATGGRFAVGFLPWARAKRSHLFGVALAVVGTAFVGGLVWLLVFGPRVVAALFPSQ